MTHSTRTLVAGQVYDVASLAFAGWSTGEDHIEGYSVEHYFDAAGRYLGPDSEGVEPLFRLRVA